MSSKLHTEPFGNMPDGKPVYLFSIENSNGMRVQVINYGARIVSAYVPDRKGNFDNVILGYNSLEHYLKGHPYLGATIGRVANRIGNATFKLDNKSYLLTKNLGENHLHGGIQGFESICWDVLPYLPDSSSIEFTTISPDGDQGYPGNLNVKVRYTLTDDNSIKIDFSATTDRSTIINLTNHAYFNLSIKTESIYSHKAKFFASNYLETNDESVPTGNLVKVEKTPLDFRYFKFIGVDINSTSDPIGRTKGYDQFFVIDKFKERNLNLMAEVEDPNFGRVLQVFSTLPGFQFYTSNFLDTNFPALNGKVCGKHSSFCIEPSYFIDSPNHPNFKSIQLKENETYNETIIYKFLIR